MQAGGRRALIGQLDSIQRLEAVSEGFLTRQGLDKNLYVKV